MHASLLFLSAFAASVCAAPTYPQVTTDTSIPDNIRSVSDYFNLLAAQVQESRQLAAPPTCDLSQVSLPEGAAALPRPSEGLTLKHIAIGRGTQNYTCSPAAPNDAPKAIGALATLFNASCLVATNPQLAVALGAAALRFDVAQITAAQKLAPSNLAVSGVHYFLDGTTALFDLDVSDTWKLGELPCGKNASTPAPARAGHGLHDEAAVAWLKLNAKPGATGGLQEVYRVETVGGSPPATCNGMPEKFEVQYSTQYWFYAK